MSNIVPGDVSTFQAQTVWQSVNELGTRKLYSARIRRPNYGLWAQLRLALASIFLTIATGAGYAAEFVVPTARSNPISITAGPDGNLWFTEQTGNKIGRITPAGVITEFVVPTANVWLGNITAGPDGNLWFAEYVGSNIGRITPAGVITEFVVPSFGNPFGISAGPDGNVWFTEYGGKIGRITPAGAISEFAIPTPSSTPVDIAAGPDGNLWFTEQAGNKIGRITPAGMITEFVLPTAGSQPTGIAAGPDGNLWFTELPGRIGRITPAGVITEYAVPGSTPDDIAAGPDGNLWFSDFSGKIGRITPAGVVTTFVVPTLGGQPNSIAAGPDGNLWFAELGGNKIGNIQAPGAPGTGSTATSIAPSTPLPPPPATQAVFAAPTGRMPTAAVSVSASDTFGNATLVVTLDLSKVLAGGSFAGQGHFAAGYNIYVAALVPSGAVGLPNATWFVLPATRSWTTLGSPIAAYMESLAQDATNSVVITVLQGLDISGLVGTEFYIGYGTSDAEMLSSGRYRGFYKAQ